MKTKITNRTDGVDIHVSGVTQHRAELLAAFEACREGKCSCPTREYEKVESLSVDLQADRITLSIKSKPRQVIDTGEIEKCLEHTKNRIG